MNSSSAEASSSLLAGSSWTSTRYWASFVDHIRALLVSIVHSWSIITDNPQPSSIICCGTIDRIRICPNQLDEMTDRLCIAITALQLHSRKLIHLLIFHKFKEMKKSNEHFVMLSTTMKYF